jgi:hypothetical protein
MYDIASLLPGSRGIFKRINVQKRALPAAIFYSGGKAPKV